MKSVIKLNLQWSICLFIAMIISVWLHEAGHGISAYIQGYTVSTGFNKVGDIYKRPGEKDFRVDHKNMCLKWDLGVPVTWTLAIISTIILIKSSYLSIIMVAGAFTFSNAIIRLIPVVLVILKKLFSGDLPMEDEISMGMNMIETTGKAFTFVLPFVLSLLISVTCLVIAIKQLIIKLPVLFQKNIFYYSTALSLFISFPILQILDYYLRVNWY